MPVINFNNIMNVKDSRWLQLEVCREFQRSKCTRPDTECKFAHPPSTVEVQNGRVTACYDSIKGRCNREKPPCKYFHPPQHLKDQLLINGRNHLALKNAFMTQLHSINPATQLVHGTVPVASTPYMTGIATMPNYSPYIGSQQVMTVGIADQVAPSLNNVIPQHVVQPQKIARTDRLEAFPGVGIPFKRPAPEKSGMTVYQPGNAAYHQALMQQLGGGQAYVPVSCEYGGSGSLALPPPTMDLPETSLAPAIPSVASSSQIEPPFSSSISTLTNSSNTIASAASIPTTSSSVPGKMAILANNSSAISHGASHSVPVAPVNVLSYAGYPINKGPRPAMKPSLIPSGGAVPAAYPATTMPGSIASMGSLAYGMAPGMPGLAFPFSNNMPMLSTGGMAHAGLSNVANMNQAVPMFPSPFMYSQYQPSSLVLPQLGAFPANAQSSWAQTSEQPYKKLKTS